MGAELIWSELVGARLRRVDLPRDELFALSLDMAAGRPVLLAWLSADARHDAFGLVGERPRGAAANAFVQRLRRELGGGRLSRVTWEEPAVLLTWARGGEERTLAIEPGQEGGNVVLLDAARLILGALRTGVLHRRGLHDREPWAPPPRAGTRPAEGEAGLRRLGASVLSSVLEGRREGTRRSLSRALARAVARLDRRAEKIAADAARAAQAPELRAEADLILAHLHAHRPGSDHLEVTDWRTEPPAIRKISIDPRLGPAAQAQALFHRARRLERGREAAARRLETTAAERQGIEALRPRVDSAERFEELEALASEAHRLGARGAAESVRAGGGAAARPHGAPARLPYRRFDGAGGRAILVGRGAADNDALTLHHARPTDLWLHARGRTGAHVVVPLSRGETCPSELLVDAATLAAHFSDGAGEQAVEIQYTPRRYVRKPRGAPAGAVLLDREKVMALRLEPGRLARLKASERR